MAEFLENIAHSLEVEREEDSLDRAAKLLRENNLDAAMRLVKQALLRRENDVTALELLGDIHIRATAHMDAVEQWERALRLQPDSQGLYSKLGNLYSRLHYFDKAISIYKRGLFFHPNNPAMHYGLAMALRENERYEEAIEALRSSCDLQPNPRKKALLLAWLRELEGKGPTTS